MEKESATRIKDKNNSKLLKAQEHIDLGQWDRALKYYEKILKKDKHHIRALLGKAKALEGMNDFNQAKEVYAKLEKISTDEKTIKLVVKKLAALKQNEKFTIKVQRNSTSSSTVSPLSSEKIKQASAKKKINNDKMHKAIENYNLTKLKKLLKKYDPNHVFDAAYETPLELACTKNNEAAVKLLLEQGANPNVPTNKLKTVGSWGTLLHYLLLSEKNFTLAELLIDAGANINALDKYNDSLIYSASISDNERLARFLLDKGVDPNTKNSVYGTILHFVIGNRKNINIAKMLINAGASITAVDKNGWSPLKEALICNSKNIAWVAIIKLMLEKGADVIEINNASESELKCALLNDTTIRTQLIAKGITLKDYYYYTSPSTTLAASTKTATETTSPTSQTNYSTPNNSSLTSTSSRTNNLNHNSNTTYQDEELFNQALNAYLAFDYAKANDYINKALSQYPYDADYFELAGHIAAWQGIPEHAATLYEAAILLDNKKTFLLNEISYHLHTYCSYYLKDYLSNIRNDLNSLDRIKLKDKNREGIYKSLVDNYCTVARFYVKEKNYQRAADNFKKAEEYGWSIISADRNYYYYQNLLSQGIAYRQLGNFTMSKSLLNKLLNETRSKEIAWFAKASFALGLVHSKQGNSALAIEKFQEAINVCDFAYYHVYLMLEQIKLKRTDFDLNSRRKPSSTQVKKYNIPAGYYDKEVESRRSQWSRQNGIQMAAFEKSLDEGTRRLQAELAHYENISQQRHAGFMATYFSASAGPGYGEGLAQAHNSSSSSNRSSGYPQSSSSSTSTYQSSYATIENSDHSFFNRSPNTAKQQGNSQQNNSSSSNLSRFFTQPIYESSQTSVELTAKYSDVNPGISLSDYQPNITQQSSAITIQNIPYYSDYGTLPADDAAILENYLRSIGK